MVQILSLLGEEMEFKFPLDSCTWQGRTFGKPHSLQVELWEGLGNSGGWVMSEGGSVQVEREVANWTGGMQEGIKTQEAEMTSFVMAVGGQGRESALLAELDASLIPTLPVFLRVCSKIPSMQAREWQRRCPPAWHPVSWESSSRPRDLCVSLQSDATGQEAQVSAVVTSRTRKKLSWDLRTQCGRRNLQASFLVCLLSVCFIRGHFPSCSLTRCSQPVLEPHSPKLTWWANEMRVRIEGQENYGYEKGKEPLSLATGWSLCQLSIKNSNVINNICLRSFPFPAIILQFPRK